MLTRMQLVTAVAANDRTKMQTTALETARNYEKEALERIRRMSLAAADLEVKGSRKFAANAGLAGPNEVAFDDINAS